jgi:hypothetical protein
VLLSAPLSGISTAWPSADARSTAGQSITTRPLVLLLRSTTVYVSMPISLRARLPRSRRLALALTSMMRAICFSSRENGSQSGAVALPSALFLPRGDHAADHGSKLHRTP